MAHLLGDGNPSHFYTMFNFTNEIVFAYLCHAYGNNPSGVQTGFTDFFLSIKATYQCKTTCELVERLIHKNLQLSIISVCNSLDKQRYFMELSAVIQGLQERGYHAQHRPEKQDPNCRSHTHPSDHELWAGLGAGPLEKQAARPWGTPVLRSQQNPFYLSHEMLGKLLNCTTVSIFPTIR